MVNLNYFLSLQSQILDSLTLKHCMCICRLEICSGKGGHLVDLDQGADLGQEVDLGQEADLG